MRTRPTQHLAFLLLAALTACSGDDVALLPPALDSLRLTIDGSHLVDSLGREIILRGVCAGGRSKFAPFFPFPFAESGRSDQANDPDFAAALDAYTNRMQTWGHNVARLPFSWEALEPTRGTFDDAYLERYATVAEQLGRRGIRVIIDFHQDAFARPFCGDGFPLWALPDPQMEPRQSCAQWFQVYFGDAQVNAAFDRFWANEEGLRDAFEAMWRHVASRLWPVEGVIGFEVINEPFYGSTARDKWNRDVLVPFYTRMAHVIHEVAPEALIIFEPSGTEVIFGRTTLEPPESDGLVFSIHYYAPSVFIRGPDDATYDTAADLLPWANLRDTWDMPVIVGEFGSRTGTAGGKSYMQANFDSLDRYRLHGTAWHYSTTSDDWNNEGYSVTGYGGEETPSAEALVRAYPSSTSGRIAQFTFDPDSRRGMLEFAATPGMSEIAAPKRLYPNGLNATLHGVAGSTAWDSVRGLLLVETRTVSSATVTFEPR